MKWVIIGRRTNPRGETGDWKELEVNHVITYPTKTEALKVAQEVVAFKRPGFIFDEDIELIVKRRKAE